MSDSPATQLSTIPSSSVPRRTSKKSGCASVFFQIFNGKRLFSRKSLPAERPNPGSVSHEHGNEKLPIAKLLLIADENVGTSADVTHEGQQEDDIILEEEVCGQKHEKRTPNVVARLMGLETMPLPEPPPAKTKQREPDKINLEWKFPSLPLQKEQESVGNSSENIPFAPSQNLHIKAKSRKPTSRIEKFPVTQKVFSSPVCDTKASEVHKWNGTSSTGASLFPYPLDSTRPSVLPSSRGGLYRNKASVSNKRSYYLYEPVNQVRESNSHPTNRTKNQGSLTQGVVSCSSNVPARDYKCQMGRGITFTDLRDGPTAQDISRPDECNARSRSRKTSCETVNKRSGDVWKHTGLQHEPVIRRMSNTHKHKLTNKSDTNKLEKMKGMKSRSDETSRRLNQIQSCRMKSRNSTLAGTQVFRQSSSHRLFLGLKTSPLPLQKSRDILSTKASEVSKTINSYVDSNILPAKTSSSSSVNGCLEQSDGLSNCMDVVKCQTSFCEETSKIMHDEVGNSADTTILEQCFTSETKNCCGGSSSATCTHSDWSCLHPLANSYGSQFLQDAGEKASYHSMAAGTAQGGVLKIEDCIQSSCESFFGDSGDTVSSHAESDMSSKTCDSISYSGKNAGAILQELLIALSSSTSDLKHSLKDENVVVSPTISKVEVTTCSLESYKKSEDVIMGQVKSYIPVPEISPMVDGSVYTRDSIVIQEEQQPSMGHSLESLCQDSISCDALESSPGEGKAGFDHSEIGDRNAVSRKQTADVYMVERAGTAVMAPAHKVFELGAVDCDALLDTISRLHCIDPKTIGLHTRDDETGTFDLGCSESSGLLSNFEKPVQNSDWGFSVSSSGASGNNEDVESFCKARLNQYAEAIVQNKKLISDCINEAFKNIGNKMYGISSFTDPLSAAHVVSKVYKQIDEWKAMAIGMNLDDMVEKELDTTTGRWHDLCNEDEAVAETIERKVFDQLLEEFALELM